MKYEKQKQEPRFAVVAWAITLYAGVAAVVTLISLKGYM